MCARQVTRSIPVGDIDHPLCVCISVIALVGWPEMNLGLVERVCDAIWEDARRQTRNGLGHFDLVRATEHVIIN